MAYGLMWRSWGQGMDPGEVDYIPEPDAPMPTPIKEPDFNE